MVFMQKLAAGGWAASFELVHFSLKCEFDGRVAPPCSVRSFISRAARWLHFARADHTSRSTQEASRMHCVIHQFPVPGITARTVAGRPFAFSKAVMARLFAARFFLPLFIALVEFVKSTPARASSYARGVF